MLFDQQPMCCCISPMDCMALARFFMIFIFALPPELSVLCVIHYRVPMQADISPMDCMAFTKFFFIVITVTSKSCVGMF